MIFERPGMHGWGRLPGILALAAVLSVVSGCGVVTSPPPVPVVSVIAPAEVALPAAKGAMKLPVTVQLYNRTRREIELFAPTPCAVFRWVVVTAKQRVQSKPNRLCAQVVATGTLRPGRSLVKFYEIELDPVHYTAGESYRLEYRFWGYPGHHDFVVADAPVRHRCCSAAIDAHQRGNSI